MSYDAMRTFADSWGLVLMAVAFLVCVGWTFLGSVSVGHRHAATSIFEQEDEIDA